MDRETEKAIVYRFIRELELTGAWLFWGLDSDALDDFQLEAIVEKSLDRPLVPIEPLSSRS